MTDIYSFGEWLKQQRKRYRLTQREVAHRSHCSVATIKKIEADQRRPSLELAELLAETLNIPAEQRGIFLECARSQRPVDALRVIPSSDAAEQTLRPSFRRPPPLPLSATPFVGRTEELATIAGKLAQPECRLLTLVGSGGVGKSRLALAAAYAQQQNFSDGAIFVALTAADSPDGIAPAIAKTLNQPLNGPTPPERQLGRLLHTKEMLLVLDNFEHLVSGGPLLSELLAEAPGLKLIVTSRERLNLAEEWLYPVSGFSPEQAIPLFEQTAQRLHPQFELAGQQTAIAAICRLVDGLPLALELAASWTRLMPCAQIAARIQQDLDFLSAGPRNAPERHHSLRALFDHSWQFLSMVEQDALARLAVFRGGFAAEEAAAIASAYLPRTLAMARRLDETEPLVAALMNLGQATPDPQEAYAVWEEVIALIADDETQTWRLANVYSHYGDRLREHGDYDEAGRCYQQSLSLMQQLGNVDMIAYPLGNLGLLALQEGRLAKAYDLISESVAISRANGNWLGIGDWMLRLGLVLLYLERNDEAALALQETLTIFEEMDNQRGQASTLAGLAHLAVQQTNLAAARKHMARSQYIYRELYEQQLKATKLVNDTMSTQLIFSTDQLDSLIQAGLVFCADNQFEHAATLFGFVEALSAHSGYKPVPPLQASMNEAIGAIRRQLAEPAFTVAWEAGQTMPPEQVLDFAIPP